MSDLVKIAVDAMGGDNSPQKIIDGIDLHNKKTNNVFYNIFGNKNIIEPIIKKAERLLKSNRITGKDVTPFLLAKIAEYTKGESLTTNIELIKSNAALAAEISKNACNMPNNR